MNRRTLKTIALITMTIDHIGMILFPGIDIFRIIGRISFPIFSYFVSESCRYSSDRLRYVLLMAISEAVCLLGYYVGMGEIYFSVMMTFIISVGIITLYDIFISMNKKGGIVAFAGAVGFMGGLWGVNEICRIFDIMYGFWGCIMPLLAYMRKDKLSGVLFFSAGIYLQALGSSAVQMYALMAVPLILLYDGKKIRSSKAEKYFYYVYYPVHIGILYIISLFV